MNERERDFVCVSPCGWGTLVHIGLLHWSVLICSVIVMHRWCLYPYLYSYLVQTMLNNFLKYYKSSDSRPVFSRVEDMLKWSGLYNLTRRSLEDELIDAGLSPLLIQELVTVRPLCNSLWAFHWLIYVLLLLMLIKHLKQTSSNFKQFIFTDKSWKSSHH